MPGKLHNHPFIDTMLGQNPLHWCLSCPRALTAAQPILPVFASVDSVFSQTPKAGVVDRAGEPYLSGRAGHTEGLCYCPPSTVLGPFHSHFSHCFQMLC